MSGDNQGVPYSIREAKLALYQLRDIYHRELYGWTCAEVDRLQALVARACAVLADVNNVWSGRFELEGQKLLRDLRDAQPKKEESSG
jgi:hypothetical protein